MKNEYIARECPKDCHKGDKDCCPFRKIVIPASMGDDSEDSEYAPVNGAYQNALVEYQANGALYIYASDGIFTKLSYQAGEGGATVSYVDNKASQTLDAAKAYADDASESAQTAAVTEAKTYTDGQDAAILAEAKAYTDGHSSTAAVVVDLTATNISANAIVATASKTAAEVAAAVAAGSTVLYRLVLSDIQEPMGFIENGTYLFVPTHLDTDGVYSTLAYWSTDFTSAAGVVLMQSAANNSATITLGDIATIIGGSIEGDIQTAKSEAIATANAYTDTKFAAAPVITVSNVDIGEGAPLAANQFYAVYDSGENE